MTPSKGDYPPSYVERPLVLPERMGQPDLSLGITNYRTGGTTETGTDLNIGFDAGVLPRLQTGLMLNLPLSPQGGFGMLVGDVQYSLASFANLRFDVGAAKLTQAMPAAGNQIAIQDTTGFVWGAGIPMKWKLGERVAVTSGRSYALAFGTPSKTNGYLTTSDDIVTMTSGSFTTPGGTISSTVWTFGLPVGILAQVHDRIGVGVRSGFRVLRANRMADDTAVPLAFDLMIHPTSPFDLGFTFELPGWTSDYGAIKTANLYALARF